MKWSDVDWAESRILIHSCKTERHEGKGTRWIPLFPELLPPLQEAFEHAEPGSKYVITRYRSTRCNLRTRLLRIIRRAGLTPWPKPFQNCRSTRQTELVESFPLHVVSAWLGNSELVAQKHYLQVTDEHFQRAAQNPAQSAAATTRDDSQIPTGPDHANPGLHGETADCELAHVGTGDEDAPGGTRTPNPWFRRPMLCPIELRTPAAGGCDGFDRTRRQHIQSCAAQTIHAAHHKNSRSQAGRQIKTYPILRVRPVGVRVTAEVYVGSAQENRPGPCELRFRSSGIGTAPGGPLTR